MALYNVEFKNDFNNFLWGKHTTITDGIYLTDLNFVHSLNHKYNYLGVISSVSGEVTTLSSLKKYNDLRDVGGLKSTYVVSDTVGRALEYYQHQIFNIKQPVILHVCLIEKSKQPETGGWRWSKWGTNITGRPVDTEYLYDDPVRDFVYIASLTSIESNIKDSKFSDKTLEEVLQAVVNFDDFMQTKIQIEKEAQ